MLYAFLCLSANTGTLSPAKSFSLSQVIISKSPQDVSVGFMNKSHGVPWVLMPLLDTDALSVGFIFPWALSRLSGADAEHTHCCPFCWSPRCSPYADVLVSLRVQGYYVFCKISVTPSPVYLISVITSPVYLLLQLDGFWWVLVWGSLARYIFSFYFYFLPSWAEGKSQVAQDYTQNP